MPARDPQEAPTEIRIDSELIQRVDAVCPKYMPRTVFINQAVDLYLNHLTPCDTLGICETRASSLSISQEKKLRAEQINHPQAAKQITSTNSERKSKNQYGKKLDPEVIPAELQDCADQIIEFWAVKKGTRSEGAATRLFNKLSAMAPMDRIKALHTATDSGWSSVFPPKPDTPAPNRVNSGYTPTQEFKHPAHQVFTAADFN